MRRLWIRAAHFFSEDFNAERVEGNLKNAHRVDLDAGRVEGKQKNARREDPRIRARSIFSVCRERDIKHRLVDVIPLAGRGI